MYTDGTDFTDFTDFLFVSVSSGFFRAIRVLGFPLIANELHLRYDDLNILDLKFAEVHIED